MSLPMFEINYDNEKTVLTDSTDKTILEISLEHGIPHMHICGGNARCSTCRVLVMDNPENLSNPGENEIKLAELKGFEKNIRLACQSRVKGNVTIRRLLHDENDVKIAVAESSGGSGKEKNIAVLFSDIRNFTSFSEKELPYDIIHILSRYFNAMGDAVINHHGYIDKYIGDGLMALFGLEDESETDTCFNAVSAALDMKKRLKNFNQYLKKNYETEFNIGIGIHFGPAVVGEMGHIKKHQLTAIGDSVNLASRIESATKKTQSELLVSENVFNQISGFVKINKIFKVSLKGKSGEYRLYDISDLNQRGLHHIQNLDLKSRLYHIFSDKIPYELGPMFIRLSFHDAGTFNASTCEGGSNGSVMLAEERVREENQGLEKGLTILEEIRKMLPEISFADLIAFAGAYSVKMLGGPEIDLPFGRYDSKTPSPSGSLPDENETADQLRNRFSRMGLTAKDLVVLSGAHTVGMAYGKPMTEDFLRFSNSYFKTLMTEKSPESLLKSDRVLLDDLELRQHIEAYAIDETRFFNDFSESFRKMTLLGHENL